MTEISHSGGCQCGAIRYRIDGDFGRAGICHCRMCQKAFGSWGAALVSVPVTTIQWTRGTSGIYRSSSIVSRGFCKDCGTPLFMLEDNDTYYDIAIGTLDDPNAIHPMTEQSGTESRVRWFSKMHTLPQQETAEYRMPKDLEKLKTCQHPDHDTPDDWKPE